MKSIHKFIIGVLAFCVLAGCWFLYSEIYRYEAQDKQQITFEIKKGESISEIATRLDKQQVVRSDWLFKKYLQWKGLDKKVRPGEFIVKEPITLARVAEALKKPSVKEREITIIPGWTLYDIAEYFEKQGIANKEEVYSVTGKPAKETSQNYADIFNTEPKVLRQKPLGVSLEGYLRPDTYRVFKDASVEEIVKKLIRTRNEEFTDEMFQSIENSEHNLHEIMTVASLLEKEVQTFDDKKKVADIFWRRYKENWALQADSTVHYITGKTGDVFTTDEARDSLNPYNTYKYPGLPPGPISNPSIESIKAAINPTENDYWYFITDLDGKVHYAKNLSGHNKNVHKYLRK